MVDEWLTCVTEERYALLQPKVHAYYVKNGRDIDLPGHELTPRTKARLDAERVRLGIAKLPLIPSSPRKARANRILTPPTKPALSLITGAVTNSPVRRQSNRLRKPSARLRHSRSYTTMMDEEDGVLNRTREFTQFPPIRDGMIPWSAIASVSSSHASHRQSRRPCPRIPSPISPDSLAEESDIEMMNDRIPASAKGKGRMCDEVARDKKRKRRGPEKDKENGAK